MSVGESRGRGLTREEEGFSSVPRARSTRGFGVMPWDVASLSKSMLFRSVEACRVVREARAREQDAQSAVADHRRAVAYSGTSAKKGWYFDFPSSTALGERSVTKPAVRTGLLTFTSLTLSNDLCLQGNGYVYQVNALTGLPFSSSVNGTTGGYASTVGIPGPPLVVALQLTSGAAQATGEVINNQTLTTLVSGTAGKITGTGVTAQAAPPTQQINWREITDWNERTGH